MFPLLPLYRIYFCSPSRFCLLYASCSSVLVHGWKCSAWESTIVCFYSPADNRYKNRLNSVQPKAGVFHPMQRPELNLNTVLLCWTASALSGLVLWKALLHWVLACSAVWEHVYNKSCVYCYVILTLACWGAKADERLLVWGSAQAWGLDGRWGRFIND